MIDIIGKRKFTLGIAALLVALSLVALLSWGLDLGIDFTGGSLMEITYAGERPTTDSVRERLSNLSFGNVQVQPLEQNGFLLKFAPVTEEVHQEILSSLRETGDVTEQRFESVGPVVGNELKKKAFTAIVIVIVLIVLYVAWAFRKVSGYISSWKYGIVTIVALLHDIIIPTGIVAVIGHIGSFEVDSYFIAALLTILGFSVQDTIVVFDRLRENLALSKGASIAESANKSVNEVMARSINTSLTVLLVLVAVLLFGGSTVQNLVIVLILGTFFGAYSSIFVASPLLVMWTQSRNRAR